MCDNSTNPKEITEGENVILALSCVKSVKAKHKVKYFVDLSGNKTAEIKTYQGYHRHSLKKEKT